MTVFVTSASAVQYGDDTSQFARDGQCDDMRFFGRPMNGMILIEDDILHDATDCRKLAEAGLISYWGDVPLDFGSDSGDYTRDGECDDPRFAGPGMTDTPLLQEDILADATDCKAAYDAGKLRLR